MEVIPMNKIEFSVSVDDLVSLNDHHCQESPDIKRMVRWLTIVPSVLCAVAGALAVAQGIMWCVILLLIALAWPFYYPRLFRHLTSSRMRRLYRKGENRSLVGKHSLCVEEDGLVHRTEHSDNRIKWLAIERLESNDDHTFIYLSAVSALVVPRHSVTNGDYDACVQEISRNIASLCETETG